MAEWFRRQSKKIKTFDKRDTTEGSWLKCPQCQEVLYRDMLVENYFMCTACQHHFRIGSNEYIKLLFDDTYKEINPQILSTDPLSFVADKKYIDQLGVAKNKTGLNDAIVTAFGKIGGIEIVLSIMDFSFIGGSMGSVVGEKISKSIEYAHNNKLPLIIVTSSGGARMQEGVYSLMQMAKISAKLVKYSEGGGIYIVLLTDPTTGGVTASFAMLGDIILSEPNALIGFAGARVIKQTIGEELPDGFQRAEFLLSKGFIDNIVSRDKLKRTLVDIIDYFQNPTDKQYE